MALVRGKAARRSQDTSSQAAEIAPVLECVKMEHCATRLGGWRDVLHHRASLHHEHHMPQRGDVFRRVAVDADQVDGNPAEDITALRHVVFVMKGGTVVKNIAPAP